MRMAASFLIACLFVSLVVSSSHEAKAQQEPKPKREGVITGRILADGRPVAGAQLIVQSAGGKIGDVQTVASDEDGNFKVIGLSPGSYSILTQIPGYVAPPDSSGPRKHRIGEYVTISLIKGGVITGRVTDEFGEPMVGVRVMAHRVRTPEGKPDFDSNVMNLQEGGRETDDRGVYRIFGLEPGVYVVGLNGISYSLMGVAQSRNEMPVYHPSSARSAAAEITVHSGDEVSSIDIRHRAVRGRSVSGTVSGEVEGGGLINAVGVTLLGAADKQPVAMAMLLGDRSFSLRGVEDGEYDLAAMRFTESMDISASVPRRVTVKGADLSGIELKLLKLGSIEGRIVMERSKQNEACQDGDDFSVEEILLNPVRDEKTPSVLSVLASMETAVGALNDAPDAGGAFVLKTVEPGRTRIETDLPGESLYVRSITQKSPGAPKPVDVSQTGIVVKSGEKVRGIEVAIAEGAASLAGKVVPANETAKLPKGIRVHLIPAEVAAANDVLRYYEKTANNDGSFELRKLAPGKYFLHLRATEEVESAANRDRPIAWDTIERAKLRRAAESAKKEIELQPCQRVKDHVLRW